MVKSRENISFISTEVEDPMYLSGINHGRQVEALKAVEKVDAVFNPIILNNRGRDIPVIELMLALNELKLQILTLMKI